MPARHAVIALSQQCRRCSGRSLAPAIAQAQSKRVLLYTGTTGFRHTDAINGGRPVVQTALETAGYTVDWEDCTNNGGGATNCDNADKNPRIFTDDEPRPVRRDRSIELFRRAPRPLGSTRRRRRSSSTSRTAAASPASTTRPDMGTTAETWNWWDGNNGNSVVGATMAGHAATSLTNIGQIQVADHNHLSTRTSRTHYGFGDEHYNFRRNVRGTHHVLATIDERTYTPGGNAMGQDHPITWCKLYDGDNINDNTGTPKSYNDGRTWVTSMGHFGASYTENSGNNNLIKQIVGGVRWVAGEGRKSDCSGTVWSSYTREVLVADANNPIGIDVAKDGKVYWSEIGNPISLTSTGYIKMHDPAKPAGNKTTVISIPTRADHGNSEDGVLGMSLQPGFDLTDPTKRNLFVYYSPRNPDWPMTGNAQVVGYNQISRFTLTADGTAAVPGLRARDPAGPQGQDRRHPRRLPGRPDRHRPGPRRWRRAGLRLRRQPLPRRRRRRRRRTRRATTTTRRWTSAPASAGTRARRRRTPPTCAARSSASRRLGDIPADAEPGVDTTYTIPRGNLFPVGTAKTRPEIYAMGFRQPFTLHTDPKNPGIVGVGRVLPRQRGQRRPTAPRRAPASGT